MSLFVADISQLRRCSQSGELHIRETSWCNLIAIQEILKSDRKNGLAYQYYNVANFDLQNSVTKIVQKSQSVKTEFVAVCLATPSDLLENVTKVGS